ncbi:hypothetical protein [Catellatospora vulcania]|uniref:hypothetical protein n=1 Tax=Catellatospora vulcania TaxID=1460450 RepID=UPI0012D3FCF5|nr:hypothetical protein [Catellatospora vulcania]
MTDSEPNRDTWFTGLIDLVFMCAVFLGVTAFFDDLGWLYYLTVGVVWLATALWVLPGVHARAHRRRDGRGGPTG